MHISIRFILCVWFLVLELSLLSTSLSYDLSEFRCSVEMLIFCKFIISHKMVNYSDHILLWLGAMLKLFFCCYWINTSCQGGLTTSDMKSLTQIGFAQSLRQKERDSQKCKIGYFNLVLFQYFLIKSGNGRKFEEVFAINFTIWCILNEKRHIQFSLWYFSDLLDKWQNNPKLT